jgi:hypothetical protein
MPLKSLVALIFGAVCLFAGVLGLAGREIRVPVAGGTSLFQRSPSEWRKFSGTEGRLMGGVLLVLGLFLVGAALHWY